MDYESSYGVSGHFTHVSFLLKMSLGAIGVAIRALEPILWEFEATPDAIIFRPVGASKHLK